MKNKASPNGEALWISATGTGEIRAGLASPTLAGCRSEHDRPDARRDPSDILPRRRLLGKRCPPHVRCGSKAVIRGDGRSRGGGPGGEMSANDPKRTFDTTHADLP